MMLVSFSLLFGKMDPWRQDLSHWIKQQTRKKHLWHLWNKHCGQFLFTQYVSMNHVSMCIQSDCRFIRIGIVVHANSVLTGVLPDTFLLAIWWRFPEIGGTTQIIHFSIGFSWIFHEINHPASWGYHHDYGGTPIWFPQQNHLRMARNRTTIRFERLIKDGERRSAERLCTDGSCGDVGCVHDSDESSWIIWRFPWMGGTQNGWFIREQIPLKWMIWRYP